MWFGIFGLQEVRSCLDGWNQIEELGILSPRSKLLIMRFLCQCKHFVWFVSQKKIQNFFWKIEINLIEININFFSLKFWKLFLSPQKIKLYNNDKYFFYFFTKLIFNFLEKLSQTSFSKPNQTKHGLGFIWVLIW